MAATMADTNRPQDTLLHLFPGREHRALHVNRMLQTESSGAIRVSRSCFPKVNMTGRTAEPEDSALGRDPPALAEPYVPSTRLRCAR